MKKLLTMILGVCLFFTAIPHTEAATSATAVLKEAKRHVGTPYVWGGSTPRGFDCSGFVQYVYKKKGKTLPRTSSSMKWNTKPVSKKNIKKGDLLFFATYKKSVSHVGIYMGEGKVIHSAMNGVRIDQIKSGYWKNTFHSAGRP